MKAPRYHLIAYKQNSSDSCMGCEMETFSSAFTSYVSLDREWLVKRLAELMLQNTNMSRGEAEYDFQVLRDGILVHDSIDSNAVGYLSHYYETEPTPDENAEGEAYALDVQYLNEINEVFAEATEEAKMQHQADQMAVQRKLAAELADKAASKVVRERAELIRLHSIYGATGRD